MRNRWWLGRGRSHSSRNLPLVRESLEHGSTQGGLWACLECQPPNCSIGACHSEIFGGAPPTSDSPELRKKRILWRDVLRSRQLYCSAWRTPLLRTAK